MIIVVVKHNPAHDLKISSFFNPNIYFTLCEVFFFTRVSGDYTTASWEAVCSFVDAVNGRVSERLS